MHGARIVRAVGIGQMKFRGKVMVVGMFMGRATVQTPYSIVNGALVILVVPDDVDVLVILDDDVVLVEVDVLDEVDEVDVLVILDDDDVLDEVDVLEVPNKSE